MAPARPRPSGRGVVFWQPMLDRILSGQQEVLLAEERQCLRGLQTALVRCQASREDEQALERSIAQLDELFLLVIVGEFNSGKSTFINALIGERILEEGVTPTTARIHRLRHAAEASSKPGADGMLEVEHPAEMLRHLQIVDTPGTNALDREHEAITRDFVPRSDLVLFVTSADRPFTESERAFIESIREWGKKLVLVVNKVDFLSGDEEREKVEEFIRDNAGQLLGFTPRIFSVSSRQALEAKLAGDTGAALERSRFAPLEAYLVETLDEREQVRLKLLNPLGVATKLGKRYLDLSKGRLDLLDGDFETLDRIDSQLGVYGEDMRAQFRFRLTDVDNELHAFEKRGLEFFDDNLRLARAFDLLNKDRLKADFERKAIGETPAKVEAKVDEIIDWMVEAELAQWQAVDESLAARKESHAQGVVGELGKFEYNRRELLDTVGHSARAAIRGYDQSAEAQRMAESVRSAVAGTAALEVGAIGLGTLITVLATTQVADVTGLLAAGTLAALGLFILPAKRKRAKAELQRKILELREQLMTGLTEQFEREVDRSAQRIHEAVAPYSSWIRAERLRLTEIHGQLETAQENLAHVKELVESI